MRLFIVLVLLVSISSSSCEKYKLKQPVYLTFHWNFFNQNSINSKAKITGGYFYLDHLNVHGVREKGPDVEIDQAIGYDEKISFSTGGNLGLSMDVPVGEYKEFKVTLGVDDDSKPCLALYGEYTTGSNIIPLRIEWNIAQDLAFLAEGTFSLKKKEDYNVVLGVDIQKLLGNISEEQWNQISVTNEDGVPTIIIRDNNNHAFFSQINHDIQAALKLIVE